LLKKYHWNLTLFFPIPPNFVIKPKWQSSRRKFSQISAINHIRNLLY
jgi:hypothetical protein